MIIADMIPMVISILGRERPLLAPTRISSLECTNNNNNNRSLFHLYLTQCCQGVIEYQCLVLFLLL